jgi:hypothetical protein
MKVTPFSSSTPALSFQRNGATPVASIADKLGNKSWVW